MLLYVLCSSLFIVIQELNNCWDDRPWLCKSRKFSTDSGYYITVQLWQSYRILPVSYTQTFTLYGECNPFTGLIRNAPIYVLIQNDCKTFISKSTRSVVVVSHDVPSLCARTYTQPVWNLSNLRTTTAFARKFAGKFVSGLVAREAPPFPVNWFRLETWRNSFWIIVIDEEHADV